MATYSYSQLEGLWIAAGGSKVTAPIAAAIALAESSGDSGANSINPDGGQNVGLWQLDTKGKGAGHTAAQLYDPATNAAVAVQGSSDGKDWSAWETFTSGAYKKFLQGGVAPSSEPGPSSSSTTSSDTSSDASAVGGVTGALKEAGTLVHDAAEALNWAFELTRPGQGQRAVMGVVAVFTGWAAVHMYRSPSAGSASSAEAPLAVLAAGISVTTAYMALRPWPISNGRPIRPAPYVVDILGGHAPAPGPAPGSETGAIEAGLWAFLGIWAASHAASGLGNAAKGLGGILGAVGKIIGAIGKTGGEAATVAGEAAAGA